MDTDFKYVRIQGKELASNTLYAKGIFSMCWQLIQQDKMEEEDKYQIAVKTDEFIRIERPQPSWSPVEENA